VEIENVSLWQTFTHEKFSGNEMRFTISFLDKFHELIMCQSFVMFICGTFMKYVDFVVKLVLSKFSKGSQFCHIFNRQNCFISLHRCVLFELELDKII